jgi:hypothetical protein
LEAHKKLPIKFEERRNNNFDCFSKENIETSKVSENKIEIIFRIQRKITLINIINWFKCTDMAQNFSRKYFSRTDNNIEESLHLIDETQTRKFVIMKINENELFMKTLKECRLDEMLRVEGNCYFICRGKIIKEKEIFKIGN